MKQVLLRLVNSYGFQSFITKLISTLSKLAAPDPLPLGVLGGRVVSGIAGTRDSGTTSALSTPAGTRAPGWYRVPGLGRH